MPNIIEQQDLLKGLPDDRLSMLMQNPTGDIPPFLVAAEAQRRQSIREQFSGGPQESVVDTLTKQLASVPQNIEAPMQTPPQMPPPQMQAGVGALEQGMRDGGMVQRYQDGSLVGQSWPYNTAAYDAYRGITSFLSPEPTLQRVVDRIGSSTVTEPSYDNTSVAYQLYKRAFPDAERSAINVGPMNFPVTIGDERRFFPEISKLTQDAGGMAFTPNLPAPEDANKKPSIPPDPNAGKNDSSIENKTAISAEEYQRELEKSLGVKAEDSAYIQGKIKELYASEGVSNWEKAQKWFDMAAAFTEPDKNLVRSIARGAAAFAEGASEEQAQERANRMALKEALIRQEIADRIAASQSERDIAKGMLAWKVSEYEADREARAQAARDKLAYERELAKEQRAETRFSIKDQAEILSDQIDGVRAQIAKLDPMGEKDQIAKLESDLRTLQGQYALLVSNYGGVDYSDLRTYNPDGTLTKN